MNDHPQPTAAQGVLSLDAWALVAATLVHPRGRVRVVAAPPLVKIVSRYRALE
jgi:hypothetical protein